MTREDTLAGRVAIVTGGGRGLGRAFALALAEAGADVALAARSIGDIERVATEVEELGRRALAAPTDVTDAAAVERLVERVLSELGDLDILVNNSGITHSAPLLETSPEEWDRVVATNLRGCFLCMRAAGRHFADRRAGKVINVASNFAFMGVPNFASYCASKAAIVNLTRAAAIEWAGVGVQVNALAPGYVETDMNAAARSDEELNAKILRQIPTRRMARPEELGPLVVYLASTASDFMTGETLVFDGGQVAK
jgi:NAD(P)-dependent dehydrogenase (short-subunit alcohol dehydrogenase family)